MITEKLRNTPSNIYYVLFGVFLTRAIYFMLWPFMSIVLAKKFELSIIFIGMTLSSAALLSIVLSIYAGYLSDKFGRKKILLAGLLGTLASFIPLTFY